MTDQRTPGEGPGGKEQSRSSQSERTPSGDEKGSGADGTAFGAGLGAATEKPGRGRTGKKRSRSKKKTASKPAAEAPEPGEARSDRPARKPRRSRKKKKVTGSDVPETAEKVAASDAASDAATAPAEGVSEPAEGRRKRSRRGGRGRKKAATRGADNGQEKAAADRPQEETATAATTEEGPAPARRRRRGSRGGRRRKSSDSAVEVETIPFEDDDLPEIPDLPAGSELLEGGAKKKRGRSSRKKAASRGGGSDSGGTRKKTARKSRAKKVDATPAATVERKQIILVNAVDREEKRVAVVDDGRINDLLMTAESQKTLVNDIYRGRVVNLEPAIGAAFVDFGQGRNGFLHTSDVLAVYGDEGFSLEKLMTATVDPDEWGESSSKADLADEVDDSEETAEKAEEAAPKQKPKRRAHHRARERQPISDLIRVGDQVVVQVTKDAIGDKGPTLTTYISIPGRYLVLMPSMAHTGVSRKIPDDKERRRLKRILTSMSIPSNMGVIVRTAGVGKTKTDLKRDLDYLLGLWESFGKRLRAGRGPVPLYQESDVAIRTLRDLFNPKTKEVVVDDPLVYDQLIEFAEQLMPEQVELIKQHTGDRPIFHHFGVEQEFEKIFTRRAELPSGGSIVFDQTEALVAIDVNSGRTRTSGFDFEAIALKTNLEAVPEMARQIRLRDLGGIIVCDFIDMMKSSSNRQVERAFRDALSGDRARSKMGRISQFGLLEMTRQRLGPGTHKKVFQACPRCRGTARIRTVQSRSAAILRRLGSALTQKGFSTIELRAHPEVVDYMKEDLFDYVRALEHRFEKAIRLVPVADQAEDSVLRYLRADDREVRPGGRRKR